MAKRKLKPVAKVIITVISAVVLAVLVLGGLKFAGEYNYRFSEAVLKDGNVKIHPGTTFQQVAAMLREEGFIQSQVKMTRFARQHERDTVQAGNYDLSKGSSYRTLLMSLAFGRQTPIRLTFNSFRTVENMAGAIARRTLADSTDFMRTFYNDSILKANGFNRQTLMSMFIPNTYEVYWTVTPEEFANRMKKEYDSFWTSSRLSKAAKRGMTPVEVSTLASIVIEETKVEDEMENVAGVYINRLQKGMPLQADPTVKFALGDPTLRRILFRHLKVNSPYNTYKNQGLPPGPIAMSPIVAIDAVLDYKGHDYYYFCANADFSGRHAFAKTLSEHNRNAAAYAAELNRRGIR